MFKDFRESLWFLWAWPATSSSTLSTWLTRSGSNSSRYHQSAILGSSTQLVEMEYLLFECLQDLTGGDLVFLLGVNSLLVDTTTAEERTTRCFGKFQKLPSKQILWVENWIGWSLSIHSDFADARLGCRWLHTLKPRWFFPCPSWSPNSTALHLDIYLLSWWWGVLWAWGIFFQRL